MHTLRSRRSSIVALAVAALLLPVGCGSSDEDVAVPTNRSLSTRTSDATEPSSCDPSLDGFDNHVAYAKAPGTLDVFAEPNATEPVQTFTEPRLTDTDPPVEVPLVFLATDEPVDDYDWIEVLLPVRPNGTTGWVRREDVTMKGNDYRIEVSLSDFNLKAFDGDELIADTTIGVASNNTPTPRGVYYTTELLAPPDPNGPYGPFAFGLSGFSEVLEEFQGGQGQLGIHGTDAPASIGTQVSNGCVRLPNDQIDLLARRFVDPYGIRVEIEP